ncbi:hypothetical protein SERLA73DRAFT_131576, partial [Serpula lacrymans var. lacrymans S7.3]
MILNVFEAPEGPRIRDIQVHVYNVFQGRQNLMVLRYRDGQGGPSTCCPNSSRIPMKLPDMLPSV